MKTFVIFGLGRSGSTLLASLLNSQSTIHCDGELFNTVHWAAWKHALLAALQRHPKIYLNFRRRIIHLVRHSQVYGFKLQLEQVIHTDQVLPELVREGWRILYLRRLSIFDAVMSNLVAQQTHRWHTHAGREQPHGEVIVLDPQKFMDECSVRHRRSARCDAIVNPLPHLPLSYEDDLHSSQQWHSTVARICDYVGAAPPTTVSSTLVKTWNRPYRELVGNYDQLLELFREWENHG
ncbi:MAG: Stf0 family sulfotransferase [Anaerolineae bacterium]|jgi:hypothetical protein|nr:Stf0 family sulfotransferase [Anaerolineae bacterium]